MTAHIVGAGEQVVAGVVDEQRVASPGSKIERLRRAVIAGGAFPLTGIHQQVIAAALDRDVAGRAHLVTRPVRGAARNRRPDSIGPPRAPPVEVMIARRVEPGRFGQAIVCGGPCAIVEEKPHEPIGRLTAVRGDAQILMEMLHPPAFVGAGDQGRQNDRQRGRQDSRVVAGSTGFVGHLPVVRLQVVQQIARDLPGIAALRDDVGAGCGLDGEHVVEQTLEVVAAVRVAFDGISPGESARRECRHDVLLKETVNVGDDLGSARIVGLGRKPCEAEPHDVAAEVVAVRRAVPFVCGALEPVEPQVDGLDDGGSLARGQPAMEPVVGDCQTVDRGPRGETGITRHRGEHPRDAKGGDVVDELDAFRRVRGVAGHLVSDAEHFEHRLPVQTHVAVCRVFALAEEEHQALSAETAECSRIDRNGERIGADARGLDRAGPIAPRVHRRPGARRSADEYGRRAGPWNQLGEREPNGIGIGGGCNRKARHPPGQEFIRIRLHPQPVGMSRSGFRAKRRQGGRGQPDTRMPLRVDRCPTGDEHHAQ